MGSLSIQLFIYVSMNSWIFVKYFGLPFSTTLYLFLLKLFQPWPLGALSVGSCVPLTYLQLWVFFFFWSTSFLYDTTNYSRFILYISCPSPRINEFSKEPGSFYWRTVLETKIWTLGLFSTLYPVIMDIFFPNFNLVLIAIKYIYI